MYTNVEGGLSPLTHGTDYGYSNTLPLALLRLLLSFFSFFSVAIVSLDFYFREQHSLL